MSRLSKLYEAMETLRKEGLPVNENLEQKANELEEKIIKEEILPIITESIAPALQKVQRELVLVVDYIPNSPISVHLSRKRNFTAAIVDAKEILPDTKVQHKEYVRTKPIIGKSPASYLRITFADGKVIQEEKALDTFKMFILDIGVMRVRSLGIKICNVPLISNTLDDKYKKAQKPIGNGWYLMTHSNTSYKKQIIEHIAKALNITLKVEII